MCGNMQIRFLQVFCYSSPSSSPSPLPFPLKPVVKVHLVFFLNAVWVLPNFSSCGVVHCDADFGGVQLIGRAAQSRFLTEEWRWRQISFIAFPPIYEVSTGFQSSKKFQLQFIFNSEKRCGGELYIYIHTHIFFLWNAPLKTNVSFSFIHSLFRGSTVCVSTLTFACCLVDFLSACVRVWRMDVYFRGVSPCTFDLEIPHERHIRKSLQGFLMSLRNFAVRHSKIWNLRSK